jgi:hypothetical protein
LICSTTASSVPGGKVESSSGFHDARAPAVMLNACSVLARESFTDVPLGSSVASSAFTSTFMPAGYATRR